MNSQLWLLRRFLKRHAQEKLVGKLGGMSAKQRLQAINQHDAVERVIDILIDYQGY